MLVSRLLRIDLRYKWAVVDMENGEIHDTYRDQDAANWHAANAAWDRLTVKRLNVLETIYCQLRGI